MRFSYMNLRQASLLWLKQSAKALVLEVETRLVVVEGMSESLEVYSVVLTSPDCRYYAIKMLLCLTESERAAVPPLFKCKYLTEPVNRYTINMDPLKGAGA